MALGVGLVGVALGGLFSIAFAVCYGRIGQLGPRATSALVAIGGFTAIELVPFLEYPADPPSVGNPATIGHRTALYFAMIAISFAASVATVLIHGRFKIVKLIGGGPC